MQHASRTYRFLHDEDAALTYLIMKLCGTITMATEKKLWTTFFKKKFKIISPVKHNPSL